MKEMYSISLYTDYQYLIKRVVVICFEDEIILSERRGLFTSQDKQSLHLTAWT